MRFRSDKTSGFTLVELIFVMAIITLIAAMIAPSLGNFAAGRNKNDAAVMIVGLAHYARTQAVFEGRTWRLNVAAAGNQVYLTAQEGGAFIAPKNTDFGDHYDITPGVRMTCDRPARPPDGQYIEFKPSGRTDTGSFLLTDKLGDTIEVACLSPTELFHVVLPGEQRR